MDALQGGQRAPVLFVCIRVSLRCSGKHIAQDHSQCIRAEQSSSMSSPCVRLNSEHQKLAPCAAVGFVCLAYQSCENNHVCAAYCLSRWSVISGPSDWMARVVCADHCVKGTPLAGSAQVFVSIEVMAAVAQ